MKRVDKLPVYYVTVFSETDCPDHCRIKVHEQDQGNSFTLSVDNKVVHFRKKNFKW